jgi:hypothetical protein
MPKPQYPYEQTLTALGHPQLPTQMKVDNSTAHGILNSNIRQKKSKAFDMRFHWLRDHIQQQQFNVYWRPGNQNKADYFSKHHPPSYHQAIRSLYLHLPSSTHMRGCVSPIMSQATCGDVICNPVAVTPNGTELMAQSSRNSVPQGIEKKTKIKLAS